MRKEKTNMSDEKKYQVVGKVEIGTDEYRDLIEEKSHWRNESDEYRRKWYDESKKVEELEKKVAAQEKAIARHKKFISLSEERTAAWNLYLAQISEEGRQ